MSADTVAHPPISAGPAASPQSRARNLPPIAWKVLSFVIFFGIWEIAGRIPVSLAFPPFSEVMLALVRLMASGELFTAYRRTLPPLAIGLAITSVLGVGLGVAMGLSRLSEWALFPPMIIMQTAPMAAIIPLITYAYGIGITAKVIAVVILSLPMVTLNSYNGIRYTSASLLEMTCSFMGTRRQQVTKIMLPHASGMIFAGLRLGISGGFIGIVLAELLITPTGIGDIISYYRSIARYAEMFAAIFSIIAFATLVLTGLQVVERRIFKALGQGSAK
ncbi:ABC transporter permease [Amorphus orientalis]|uniref:NitT/TauT family transport system permease protein n=1 Tax=Amorphus orientalis TaxID=649198 RepID=A0AAE3VS83_9HYPH|nr:ABC transporter permease [Amorphus orientalis]MDQ0316855.1 NitT/TauT family transport system permease protein [Amorphus orientalis]